MSLSTKTSTSSTSSSLSAVRRLCEKKINNSSSLDKKRKRTRMNVTAVAATAPFPDFVPDTEDEVEFTDLDSDEEEIIYKKMKIHVPAPLVMSTSTSTSTPPLPPVPMCSSLVTINIKQDGTMFCCHVCKSQPATHGAIHAPGSSEDFGIVHRCFCEGCASLFKCMRNTTCPVCKEYVLLVSKIL